ncbi:hypothetical protein [Suttonella ornithocola]|uniref:Lipopolysaccharide assembly protein B n=1 Tax=Suttonella ornithocola TaxID=279832 RepID=A0A380MVF4_9GAMM|nr:hypothetical protein [Suttonella ornithocola]SUO95387.1 tetratricopeptide repeat protein [Suttonella ornithocola]
MSEWLVIFLLPLAAWSGWWIGMRKEARDLRLSKSRTAYFEGLSFLLNDQTDKAIDVFLSMAEIDRQTFDNQLTLGALFRKRGELDRALHLHRQLADLPALEQNQLFAVEYELAEDYLASGMFRQAQELLEPLADKNFRSQEVYIALWRIYERTAQWQKAIEISELWQNSGYGNRRSQIAHYYCELAEKYFLKKCLTKANEYLKLALESDSRCGRAYWMQAQIAVQNANWVSAIYHYHSIAEQADDFVPDILPAMFEAYHAIARDDEYLSWLKDKEASLKQTRLTLAVAQYLATFDVSKAFALIKSRLEGQHQPLLLSAFLHYHPDASAKALGELLGRSIEPKTVYQCNECGFRQQRIVWHCPACHAWSSFRPLIELKLEQR